jgi:hypothetical protein
VTRPGVTVTGARETIATLERIGAEAAFPPRSAAEILAGAIMAEAPVRTGELRSSVTPDPESATVTVLAEYGVYVQAQNPFVTRGGAAAERALADAWERNIADVIRREGAG